MTQLKHSLLFQLESSRTRACLEPELLFFLNLQIMCLLTDHFEKCQQIIFLLFWKYPARRQSQGTGSYSGPEIRVGNLWCGPFGSDNFLEILAAGFVMTSNVLWFWIPCYFWILFHHSSQLRQGSLCFFPFPSPLSLFKKLFY